MKKESLDLCKQVIKKTLEPDGTFLYTLEEGFGYNRNVNPHSRLAIFIEAVDNLEARLTKENAEEVVLAFYQADTNHAITGTTNRGYNLGESIRNLGKSLGMNITPYD